MEKKDFYFIGLAPIWSAIENIGEQRDEQKKYYKTSNQWRDGKSTNIIAVAGEMIAAFMLQMPMDATLRASGDAGYDLPDGTDVKTDSHWPPILKHPIGSKKWPTYFALVYFDENTKSGCLIGKVTARSLLESEKTRQFRPDAPVNHIMEIDAIMENNIWKPNGV